MPRGYTDDQIAVGKETTKTLVERLWPDEAKWFDALWESIWRFAEAVDVNRVGRRDLEELAAAGLGFARPDVEPAVESRPFVGTIVFVLVGLGPEGLRGASGVAVSEATNARGKAWAASATVKDAVVRAIQEQVRPAVLELAAAVGEEQRRRAGTPADMLRVAIWQSGESLEDGCFTPGKVVALRKQYEWRKFECRVDETGDEAVIGGRQLSIKGRPVEFLARLLLGVGERVTNAEFLRAMFGEEEGGVRMPSNVTVAKYVVCRAIADAGMDWADYVDNIPGKGYRWVGPMTYFLICRTALGK